VKDKARLSLITLNDTQSLPQLKDLLNAEGAGGNATIHLILPLNDNENIEMELKGTHKLNASTVNAIRQLSGVQGLRDV
jgi:hypothetical protein